MCSPSLRKLGRPGGKVVHWVSTHPKEAIGLGLGAVSILTGGVGLAADLAFEGTALTTTVADVAASGPA